MTNNTVRKIKLFVGLVLIGLAVIRASIILSGGEFNNYAYGQLAGSALMILLGLILIYNSKNKT